MMYLVKDKGWGWIEISFFLHEENYVGEAVEPAVDHQQPHGDLAAAEDLHFLLRIFLRHQTNVEEAASREGCVEP